VGRLEWNRCSYIKDPKSGKRVARPNSKPQWEIVEVPELRVIEDGLWNAAKLRQRDVSFEIRRDDSGNALNRAHRRKFLLSGLLKCGCCGGGFTIVAQDRYGCATRRAKGTCDNGATVSRQEIEARVLEGLKERLMAPELVREDSLRAQTSEMPPTSVRLHPRLADVYAEKVQQLETALNDPAIRDEAADVLRSLIDRIELNPRDGGKGVYATLHGALAQILALCVGADGKRKLPKAGTSGSQLSVVAGARNQRCLHLDYAAL